MTQKIPIQLASVQKTLLLPLWGRAVESRKKNPLLSDQTAVEIIDSIDYDFSTITKNMHPLSQLSWIARSLYIDRIAQEYLQRYPRATVINIGCGLDTTFERIDNGTLTWYDLDLPDVIELRRKFIPELERRRFISSSLFEDGWFREVRTDGHVVLLSAGVFYYFEEERIKGFFKRMLEIFPNGELVFDAASAFGIRVANKRVIRDGGMDETSVLKWGCNDANIIHEWDSRLNVVDISPMFRGIRKKLGQRGKFATLISDLLNVMYLVHIRFPNASTGEQSSHRSKD